MNPMVINTQNIINSPIILALDYANEIQVLNLVKELHPSWCKLKVGKELFTACGAKLVEKLVVSGYQVFLDLKFHDIPNTVYNACKVASNLGVWMINVHGCGGTKMLEMAKKAIIDSGNQTLIIAVTLLTSMTQSDLAEIGIQENLLDYISRIAKLSYNAGLDGVVCSAHEAKYIKDITANTFLTVTPGIRLVQQTNDDQQRIMTPQQALDNKADYLVIGRPITHAPQPQQILQHLVSTLHYSAPAHEQQ